MNVLQAISQLSLTTVALSLIVYAVEYVRRRLQAVRDRRRLAVERALTTVEVVARRRSSWSRYLLAPEELEYALLVPRLLLDLGPKHDALAGWVARQVQLMQSTSSASNSMLIGIGITNELLEWQRGHKKIRWFKNQLAGDPYRSDFQVPRRVRQRQWLNRFGASFAGWSGVVVLIAALKRLIRNL